MEEKIRNLLKEVEKRMASHQRWKHNDFLKGDDNGYMYGCGLVEGIDQEIKDLKRLLEENE